MLLELGTISRFYKSEYAKIIQKLKSGEEKSTKLKEQTLHLKQFSSYIQVLLGTYQGNKSIVSETKSITDAIGASKDYELKTDFNSFITKLPKIVQDFGNIKVTKNTSKLDFRDPKIEQAQISISVPTSRKISSIQLQLIKTFRISEKMKIDIRGCVMLSNGHLLMANYTKNYLIEYNDSAEHNREIRVSGSPFGVAVIDPRRNVVTNSLAEFLEKMNNNTFQIEKRISFQDSC
ncbi:unnamed protein product [Mytilus coruscus]|uniref:Uncharacterized protein n=1 Tax=Mytilus coruscus TaxID=42192 RepID=A0A6J8CDY5_MYTCO|nr:unnamed protein product [Mytilus coruscus]